MGQGADGRNGSQGVSGAASPSVEVLGVSLLPSGRGGDGEGEAEDGEAAADLVLGLTLTTFVNGG
jgi:hypothetical protein